MRSFSLAAALCAHQALAIVLDTDLTKRAAVAISVNTTTKYQTIDGFGFSEAFGYAEALYGASAAIQTEAFELLFSNTTGAALNIIRNRIPSTSYDTIEPTSPGSPTATPTYVSIGTDDDQIWFAQNALKYGVTNIIADAWSAPAYMKTNNDESEGGYLCGVTGETCKSGDWRQAFADYIVQYLKDYQANGVNYTYVGFLNEPEYTGDYSSMNSDGTQAASFLEILAPTIKASGLDVGITCCDNEGWDTAKTFISQINTAGQLGNISVYTAHSYSSSPDGPLAVTVPVWMTEYCDLNGVDVTAWYSSGASGEGLTWANRIYTCLVNSNCAAYLHWVGVQSGTADATLIYLENNSLVATARLWAFAQWSRYVQPGAVRLEATGSTSTLLASAFRNKDGSVSVQVINNSNAAQSVSISTSNYTATAVTAHLSDNTVTLNTTTATLAAGVISGSVPERAMITYVLT